MENTDGFIAIANVYYQVTEDKWAHSTITKLFSKKSSLQDVFNWVSDNNADEKTVRICLNK